MSAVTKLLFITTVYGAIGPFMHDIVGKPTSYSITVEYALHSEFNGRYVWWEAPDLREQHVVTLQRAISQVGRTPHTLQTFARHRGSRHYFVHLGSDNSSNAFMWYLLKCEFPRTGRVTGAICRIEFACALPTFAFPTFITNYELSAFIPSGKGRTSTDFNTAPAYVKREYTKHAIGDHEGGRILNHAVKELVQQIGDERDAGAKLQIATKFALAQKHAFDFMTRQRNEEVDHVQSLLRERLKMHRQELSNQKKLNEQLRDQVNSLNDFANKTQGEKVRSLSEALASAHQQASYSSLQIRLDRDEEMDKVESEFRERLKAQQDQHMQQIFTLRQMQLTQHVCVSQQYGTEMIKMEEDFEKRLLDSQLELPIIIVQLSNKLNVQVRNNRKAFQLLEDQNQITEQLSAEVFSLSEMLISSRNESANKTQSIVELKADYDAKHEELLAQKQLNDQLSKELDNSRQDCANKIQSITQLNATLQQDLLTQRQINEQRIPEIQQLDLPRNGTSLNQVCTPQPLLQDSNTKNIVLAAVSSAVGTAVAMLIMFWIQSVYRKHKQEREVVLAPEVQVRPDSEECADDVQDKEQTLGMLEIESLTKQEGKQLKLSDVVHKTPLSHAAINAERDNGEEGNDTAGSSSD